MVAALASVPTLWSDESPSSGPRASLPDHHLDLRTCTADELAVLPGIGPALGRRIVESREKDGAFREIEALERVRGIGPATLEAIRPFLRADATGTSG